MTYDWAVLLDSTTLVVCVVLLVRFGNLSHSHPATIYLVFHGATFSLRLLSLSNGAIPLWGTAELFEAIREEEITRAMVLADMALAIMTVAWLLAARRTGPPHRTQEGGTPLNRRLVLTVVAIALPIGLLGLLGQTRLGGQTVGPSFASESQAESGYYQILPVWPGLVLLVLIYCYGFRWWLLVPMVTQLFLMGIQGYHRFRVFIPIILLIQIWLDRHGRRWPTRGQTVLLLASALVFFPLKTIGKMVQDGHAVGEIAERSQEIISDALVGHSDDQMLLDEFACSLTLVDEAEKLYWGQPYLALITLPIPRAVWREKPTVADYISDFSRPWRPMRENGMIVTFLGEAYANFGYGGVLLIPFLLAYLLARAHQRLMSRPFGTVGHFTYLLVACNLIQVFRDGLTSIVFFVFVHMLPLATISLVQLGLQWSARLRPVAPRTPA